MCLSHCLGAIMPSAVLPISNIQDSIDRPVTFDVVRQVMDVTHISSKTPIRFLGDEAKAAQMGSLITKDYMKENIWPSDEFVTIEIEAELDKDYAGRISGLYVNSALTFCDDQIGLVVKPIYAMESITINFKYSAKDRASAKAWHQRMASMVGNQALVRYHDITYHYEFPEQILQLVHHCWELRENQGGWGDTFEDYVKAHLSRSATCITDSSGKNATMVIAERQTRVQGWFEFDVFPDKPSKAGDTEVFDTSFTYKFMFEKPIDYQVFYPNVVHNQLVNPEYRYTPIRAPEVRHKASGFETQALMYFENDQRAKSMQISPSVTIPWFDEFSPIYVLPSSVKVFSMLVGITPTDLRSLVNIKTDIVDWELRPEVLDYLLGPERNHVCSPFQSIFNLSLYEGNDFKPGQALELLPNGQIRSLTDLNIRKTYHIRLSLITNLQLVATAAFSRIKSQPVVRDQLIAAISHALANCSGDADIVKSKLDYRDLIRLGVDPTTAYSLVTGGKTRTEGRWRDVSDEAIDPVFAATYCNWLPSLTATLMTQIHKG